MTPDTHATGAQLAQLHQLITDGFTRLEKKVEGVEVRVADLEKSQAGAHVVDEYRITENKNDIDNHSERLDEAEMFIASLRPWLKVLMIAGTSLLLSITALVWSMITGQVTLVMP